MIDPSLMKYLSDGAATELRHWESLFASKGWKQLQTVLEGNFEAAKHKAIHAQSWEENRVAYGAMDALRFVFNAPDMVETNFTTIAEEAREAAIAQEESEEEAVLKITAYITTLIMNYIYTGAFSKEET